MQMDFKWLGGTKLNRAWFAVTVNLHHITFARCRECKRYSSWLVRIGETRIEKWCLVPPTEYGVGLDELKATDRD